MHFVSPGANLPWILSTWLARLCGGECIYLASFFIRGPYLTKDARQNVKLTFEGGWILSFDFFPWQLDTF